MSDNTDKHLIKSMSRWASENGSGVVAQHIEILAKEVNDLEQKLESKEQCLADANDQIERQRERYKELEAANRWVPVSEKLPDEKTHVVLYREHEEYALPGYLSGGSFYALSMDIGKSWHSGVTHWKPITPPEQA